jgi:hypothetical protein
MPQSASKQLMKSGIQGSGFSRRFFLRFQGLHAVSSCAQHSETITNIKCICRRLRRGYSVGLAAASYCADHSSRAPQPGRNESCHALPGTLDRHVASVQAHADYCGCRQHKIAYARRPGRACATPATPTHGCFIPASMQASATQAVLCTKGAAPAN